MKIREESMKRLERENKETIDLLAEPQDMVHEQALKEQIRSEQERKIQNEQEDEDYQMNESFEENKYHLGINK